MLWVWCYCISRVPPCTYLKMVSLQCQFWSWQREATLQNHCLLQDKSLATSTHPTQREKTPHLTGSILASWPGSRFWFQATHSPQQFLLCLTFCLYTILCPAGSKSGTWLGMAMWAAQGADTQQAYTEMWGKVSSLRKDGKWNQMPPILRERRNQIWSFRWLDGSCSCSETVGPKSALIKSLMLQGDKHDLLCITGMKQEHRRSHRNNSLSSSRNTVEFYWEAWGMYPGSIPPTHLTVADAIKHWEKVPMCITRSSSLEPTSSRQKASQM